MHPQSIIEYVVDESTGCWLWMRQIHPDGYAIAWNGMKQTTAHRVIYTRHKGPIPPGHELHHRCEIKHCVNPEHVEPVIRRDHKRLHHKLTPGQEAEAIALDGVESCRRTAKRFGVSPSHIHNLRRGKYR